MTCKSLMSYGFTRERLPKPPYVKLPKRGCCCHCHLRQTSLCEHGFVPSEHLDHDTEACPVYCSPKPIAEDDHADSDSEDEDEGSEHSSSRKRGPCPHCTQLLEQKERECAVLDRNMSAFYGLMRGYWHNLDEPLHHPFGYLPIDHYVVSLFESARAGLKGVKNLRQPLPSSETVEVAGLVARVSLEGMPVELKVLIVEALLEDPQPSSLIALQCLITVSDRFFAVIQSNSGQKLVHKYKAQLKNHVAVGWLKKGYFARKEPFKQWAINGPLKPKSFVPRDLFTTCNQRMDFVEWNIRVVRTWYGDANDDASMEESDDECYGLFEIFEGTSRWCCMQVQELLDDPDRYKATANETRNVKGFRKTLPPFIVEALSDVICFQDYNHLWNEWSVLNTNEGALNPKSNIKKQPRTLLIVIDEEATKTGELLLLYLNGFGQIIPSLTKNVDPEEFHQDFMPPENMLSMAEVRDMEEEIMEDLAEMEDEFMEDFMELDSDATDGW